MKISERQHAFLKALHTVFPSEAEISTRAVNAKLVGLALKEPGSVELLKAIVGCIGRKVNAQKIGRLLEKVRGRRIGDLELVCDPPMKVSGRWRYYLKDHAAAGVPMPSMPRAPRFNSLEEVFKFEDKQKKILEQEAEDLRRFENMARIKADPQLTDAFCRIMGRQRLEGATRGKPADRAKYDYDPNNSLRAPEPLTHTQTDNEGRVHVETIFDPRTGEPVPERPATAPKAAPAIAPSKITRPVRMPKINEGGKWREMTLQEYEAGRIGPAELMQAAAVHYGHIPMHLSLENFDEPAGAIRLERFDPLQRPGDPRRGS